MLHRGIAALVCGIAWLMSAHAARADDVLKVRVSQFAPNYFRADGRWVGLDVELAEAVAARAGLTPVYVELPWSRALAEIASGQVELMMNLSYAPDREATMVFVGPVRDSERVLVVRRENLGMTITGLDDLVRLAAERRQRFGIQDNARYTPEFDARLKADPAFAAAFDPVPMAALLPNKTLIDRNLGYFEEGYGVRYAVLSKPEYADLAIHPFVLLTEPIYFGVTRIMAADKLARIKEGYAQAQADGALAAVRQRWHAVVN